MIREKIEYKNEPVFLIDGSSFLYRAFYAYPDLKRSDGLPTNAIYIVIRMLLKIVKEEKPEYMGFFLDGKGPTFRHELYIPYKAQRPGMPEGLSAQIEPLREAVRILGIPEYTAQGLEADDLIAGYTEIFKSKHPVIIVASDKDLKQLLDDHVYLWDPGAKNAEILDCDGFRRETGIGPEQWPDYQALVGDSSDNIPGIPGVGPKTALNWLKKFPSLEELQAGLDELKPKEQEKLREHMDDVFLYRRLTKLKPDCLSGAGLETLKTRPADPVELQKFLDEYEFKSLKNEIPGSQELKHEQSREKGGVQKAWAEKEELPDCRGQITGLYLGQDSYLVALEDQEWEVSKKTPPIEKLEFCKKYVFSLKDLYRENQDWMQEPVSGFFDISLGVYLLNPEERDYSFDRIFRTYAPEIAVHRENRAVAALKIGQMVEKRLDAAGLLGLMQELEMPLVPVLCRMESAGIGIDLAAFDNFLRQVKKSLDDLTASIYSLAGKEFNIRSTQQTAQVLFDELGLKARRKTPKGAYSTSNVVLESMRRDHDIVDLILQYRTLEKLRSTYLEPLPRKVDVGGRLHTTFNQLATATGRLSSSNPNLQNIPIKGEFGPRMRACFKPSKGKLLVAADYSQIELRILAHMSMDPNLLQAFGGNEDIHRRTAGLLFDKDIQEVSQDERRKAKTINFGLLYGMGPQKLSRELSISMEEAKEFISVYFSKLDRVRDFYQQIEEKAQEQGYVTTMAGRRRLLPDINSRNTNMAQQARRTAVNTVIQGSAADVIKKAMLAVDSDSELRSLGSVMVLQVHDELLLEVDAPVAQKAGERLARVMAGVESLEVPLLVEWGTGENWAEAHG
ncbi:DNA polymerase I [Desulfonatronospira thiodismutans ASO3-1]|uniref:DNA polymerase I n=2 Tax=Desulfonatronospira TaxID=488937 RepID=D6SQA5_9BACT|nr:DNA polymerase I [Desulfonatronospira thiodismutans]EFI34931.1 DNA polymerase I [Desulfonatronospira thiodismutans ASO3-1]